MTRTRLGLNGWAVLSLSVFLSGCGGGDDDAAVATGNKPPALTGSPVTSVTSGSTYRFKPAATDADGDELSFGIESKPKWASFNAVTGELTGTPAETDVGTYRGIVVWVTDGKGRSALPAFDLIVAKAGTPVAPGASGSSGASGGPATSGADREPADGSTPPSAIAAGMAYSFTPDVGDLAGKALKFSVANLPSWASFDETTGRVWGTPGAEHVGTTRGIVISVRDGAATAMRAEFDLTVQAVATGSATLAWAPPTVNTDGSPLTNLAGYKLYWGMAPGDYANSVTVSNPGITAYVVSNLASGTWYFVMTALNTLGGESSFSNEALHIVP